MALVVCGIVNDPDNDGSPLYDFIALAGAHNPLGENIEDITRANLDGVAYRRLGKQAAPVYLMSSRDVNSTANAKTLIENYKLLQGTVVTYWDGAGIRWDSVAVLSVEPLPVRRTTAASGGYSASKLYLVQCRWVLQATEIPA